MDQDSVTSLVRFDIKFTYKIIADFCEMLKSQPAAVKSLCWVLRWGEQRRNGFSGENKMEPAHR